MTDERQAQTTPEFTICQSGDGVFIRNKKTEDPVCDFYFYEQNQHGHRTIQVEYVNARENAELIVRAVNSHADLVAAAEAGILMLKRMRLPANVHESELEKVLQQLESALAKGKGKT